MLASNESLLCPSTDPSNQIGLSYFNQRDKAILEQKVLEASVNFSISVAVLGGPGSGKNTLLATECQEMNEYVNKTAIKGIGIQIYTVGENKVRVNYHVAPGNEMHLKLSAKLLTGLTATLYVFDVNDERGLDYLDDWLDHSCPNRIYTIPAKKYLIGNKIDTPGNRVIFQDMAREFAEINCLEYVETCANNRTKVHALFQEIAYSLVSIAISSAKPLPQFVQKLSKTQRKKVSSKIVRNSQEMTSSPSLFFKSSATEGSTDILKHRDGKHSTSISGNFSAEQAADEEVFYGLKYQVGVSLPRKNRVFQRVCNLRESPLINEGTLVLDWM